jgi:sulfur carrier protein
MNLTIQLNGIPTPLQDVRTIHDLVLHLGYADKRIAVEQNGDIVPRSQHAQAPLAEGDHIEIVVAVGGG